MVTVMGGLIDEVVSYLYILDLVNIRTWSY